MVDEIDRSIMTAYDWTSFGIEDFDGQLPMRRLQIPLPHRPDCCFQLAQMINAFAEQVRLLGNQDNARHTARDLHDLVRTENKRLQKLRETWERELPENQPEDARTVEQIRAIR